MTRPNLDAALVAAAIFGVGVACGSAMVTVIGPDPAPAVTVTAPPSTVTVTTRVTLPPKVVTRTVEVTRASRSSQRVDVPERTAGRQLSGWQRVYWQRAQVWAATARVRAVIACESSNRVNAVSSTGKYRGLYQMDRNFWRSYGGLTFAPSPDLASRAAQNYVAYRGFVSRGWAPWECA